MELKPERWLSNATSVVRLTWSVEGSRFRLAREFNGWITIAFEPPRVVCSIDPPLG